MKVKSAVITLLVMSITSIFFIGFKFDHFGDKGKCISIFCLNVVPGCFKDYEK